MAIDDPIEAFDQQYMQEEATLPGKLAKYAAEIGFKLAISDSGLASDILLKVAEALFDKPSGMERVNAFFKLVSGEFRHVEKTKASHDDVQKAIQLAIWYDRHERDDSKRERYVKLIGNAVRSEEHILDIASFIQTIELLNERDVIVLKVLNRTMNKQGDWRPQHFPPNESVMRVHPNIFIQRAEEFALQVAQALGQNTDRSTFSREEGYSICGRLVGFGLAHEIETQARELPLTNYCFRLSTHGIRLLKLIGGEVPNYECYFKGV